MPSTRHRVTLKSVATIGAVALVIVVGYDWYKHNLTGPVGGARPASVL